MVTLIHDPGGPSTPHSALKVIFISLFPVPATEKPSEVAPASLSALKTWVVVSVSLATRVAKAFNISAEAVDPMAAIATSRVRARVNFLSEQLFMVVLLFLFNDRWLWVWHTQSVRSRQLVQGSGASGTTNMSVCCVIRSSLALLSAFHGHSRIPPAVSTTVATCPEFRPVATKITRCFL